MQQVNYLRVVNEAYVPLWITNKKGRNPLIFAKISNTDREVKLVKYPHKDDPIDERKYKPEFLEWGKDSALQSVKSLGLEVQPLPARQLVTRVEDKAEDDG